MKTFAEFWPFYCREHSKPLTRRLHFVGSLLAPIAVIAAWIATGSLWALALYPVIGYGFAWGAHFFVEKNKPATFQYPFWSLAADYVMVGKMLTAKMDEEVRKALAR